MGAPTNRERIERYLRKVVKTGNNKVTALDVAKECDLVSPQQAALYMRDLIGGDGEVRLILNGGRIHGSGAIYQILIVTS